MTCTKERRGEAAPTESDARRKNFINLIGDGPDLIAAHVLKPLARVERGAAKDVRGGGLDTKR